MSLGTAGAVNDACRRLAEARRSAAALGGGRVYGRVFDARADPQFETFPCGSLCMECRFLADPPNVDPMRTVEGDGERLPCPHCGSTAWTDLRNADAKEQIDTVDAFDRLERRRNLRRYVVRSIGAAIVLTLVGALVVELVPEYGWGHALFAIAMMTFLSGPIIAIGAGALSSGYSVASVRRKSPARWRMAAPRRPRRNGVEIHGAAHPEHAIVAPLTGRTCAAYEIGIRRDERADAKLSSWLLLEQGCPALQIGEAALGPGQAYLHLRRAQVEAADVAFEGEALSQFLRARGLDPAARYVFFETIVPVGHACRLFAGRGKAPPVLELA